MLIGDERWLRPLFNECVEVLTPTVSITGKGTANLRIRNNSDITFVLAANGASDLVSVPGGITLPAGKTVIVPIRSKSDTLAGKKRVSIPVRVTNVLTGPDQGMAEEIEVTVNFAPAAAK